MTLKVYSTAILCYDRSTELSNNESLTDKNYGKHVPGSGKHAGRTQHREIEDLPTTPITQSTQSLVQFHTSSMFVSTTSSWKDLISTAFHAFTDNTVIIAVTLNLYHQSPITPSPTQFCSNISK